MKKLVMVIFLAGCASSPEQLGEIQRCKDEGNKAIVNTFGALKYCISPEEQERLNELELACVSAGGTVVYYQDKYENCKGNPSVKVNVNSGGGFKPYCPPGSQGKVYGC